MIESEEMVMHKQTLYKIGRLLMIVSLILLCIIFIRYTFHILYPIVIAFLFALLLDTPVTFLHNRYNIPRVASTIILLFLLCVFVIWAIFFVFSELMQGTAYLAEKIPSHIHYFTQYIEHFIQSYMLPFYHKTMALFSTLSPAHQETIEQNIHGFMHQSTEVVLSFIQFVFKNIPAFLSIFPQSLVMIVFIIIATFLLSIDFKTYTNQLQKIIPTHVRSHGLQVLRHIKKTLYGYTKAQVTLVLITCFLLYIGLFMIGVNHALTIVIFAAFVDFLPYIGTGIIFIPWIIYVFITEQFELTIQLSIMYGSVVFIRQIIEPKLISAHLNLRPITALLALFIGFKLWGIIGMLLAPLSLIILTGIYQAGTFHLIWRYIMNE